MRIYLTAPLPEEAAAPHTLNSSSGFSGLESEKAPRPCAGREALLGEGLGRGAHGPKTKLLIVILLRLLLLVHARS